jgi:hypothetical protein
MRNGKKLTASSLFTIIGVVCFATILVAAAVTLSNSLNINKTPTEYPLTIGDPEAYAGTGGPFNAFPLSAQPVKDNEYAFQVDVTTASGTQDAVLHITVSGGTLSLFKYSLDNGGTWTDVGLTGGTTTTHTYTTTSSVAFRVTYSSTTATTINILAQDV